MCLNMNSDQLDIDMFCFPYGLYTISTYAIVTLELLIFFQYTLFGELGSDE